ncbi:MAG: beta-ketoacyl-[acyl-carrier-protein] synthase family protein [Planctomycetota bacterium]
MSPPRRVRVVVTGLGAWTCVGRDVASLREALRSGRTGLRRIRRFDPAPYRNPVAGECEDPPPSVATGAPHRGAAFLAAALAEARANARMIPGDRSSLVAGTNFGGLSVLGAALRDPAGAGAGYFLREGTAWAAAAAGMDGARTTLSLSCASGAAIVGVAFDLIAFGRVERCVAAAYDELSEAAYAGLCALRAVTPLSLRPFDRRRSGTLFAEGAGALVLESLESARGRGVPILAEVLGQAINNDAHNLTAPEMEGRGIAGVMAAALLDAGLAPSAVDHVNAHGTGTLYNDPVETAAIHRVLGDRARQIPVVSIKPIVGHAMGAAGAIEIIATVLTLSEGFVPPTLGLEEPDPACDLDYVPGRARPFSGRIAISNSYGIGGANACVVLKKWEGP